MEGVGSCAAAARVSDIASANAVITVRRIGTAFPPSAPNVAARIVRRHHPDGRAPHLTAIEPRSFPHGHAHDVEAGFAPRLRGSFITLRATSDVDIAVVDLVHNGRPR